MNKILSHLILEKALSQQTKGQALATAGEPILAIPHKRKVSTKIKIGWGLMLLLALNLFVFAGRYLTFDPEVFFQKEVYLAHTGFLYMHIVGSMLAIIIGPFQFLRGIRVGKYAKVHRWLGRIYMLGVLFGGLGGLYMSTLAYAGIFSKLGFMGLAIAWLTSGYMAYTLIRKKEIELHRRWMKINYALTFAGVTFRLWLMVFGMVGLDILINYPISAWLSWIVNLVVAWWLITKNKSNQPVD